MRASKSFSNSPEAILRKGIICFRTAPSSTEFIASLMIFNKEAYFLWQKAKYGSNTEVIRQILYKLQVLVLPSWHYKDMFANH
ncbi:MAG: hypothetical protein M3250_03965 [Thermoproteota archaeon]|nr:hypothetical protein [Thermoproteota archaeon]